jgi:hypothetical protein
MTMTVKEKTEEGRNDCLGVFKVCIEVYLKGERLKDKERERERDADE